VSENQQKLMVGRCTSGVISQQVSGAGVHGWHCKCKPTCLCPVTTSSFNTFSIYRKIVNLFLYLRKCKTQAEWRQFCYVGTA